ncbi:hypothetical protein EJB10_03765 [Wolbachia endosymbiont of Brugia malayi]|uniref:hypothetical protein n=1 Tax=Wolbachia endosymbiont of Brugia malayi TaxID=80849 RepID=UPI0002D8D0B4|nr:hypothetical protein [Wolbachia endosymbiont of Brugia malayi]QCB61847.1 hypothetical protein EJB10_03765 [Wolbachia endosymbiont of Brugia malayi]
MQKLLDKLCRSPYNGTEAICLSSVCADKITEKLNVSVFYFLHYVHLISFTLLSTLSASAANLPAGHLNIKKFQHYKIDSE